MAIQVSDLLQDKLCKNQDHGCTNNNITEEINGILMWLPSRNLHYVFKGTYITTGLDLMSII